MGIGFLDSFAGGFVIKNDLTGVNFFVFVDLPEDGCSWPVFGGSNKIG